jgi:hypothetical protein
MEVIFGHPDIRGDVVVCAGALQNVRRKCEHIRRKARRALKRVVINGKFGKQRSKDAL